jgi:hypothetical protein
MFNDPEIVELLRTGFIAAATDRDAAEDRREQDFFRKITTGSPRDEQGKPLQGYYVGTPDGKPLASSYKKGEEDSNKAWVAAGNTVEDWRKRLRIVLADFKPAQVTVIEPSKSYSPFRVKPPKGGLVVNVYAKVLGSYQESDYKESPAYVLQYLKAYQSSIGRDHLWIWKDEHKALVRGVLPESLKRRIARYHLDDNTVGGFPGWRLQEVKKVDLTLHQGRLTGSVLLETAEGKRGYEAEVLGFVETKDGRVTRFDVVVKGQHWGSTAETRGAPDGKHPLAIAFSLVTGNEETDKIPPAMIFEEGYQR